MDVQRRRVLGFALLMGLGLAVGAARLTWLTLGSRGRASASASVQSLRTQILPATRGSLRDRHGRLLAGSVPTLRLEVLPRNVLGRRAGPGDKARLVSDIAAFLAPRVHADVTDLARRLTGTRYTRLGQPVSDPDVIAELTAEKRQRLYGVDFTADAQRRYPWGAVAGNLLGYVDHESRGVAGLEQGLQSRLSGVDGARRLRVDQLGREVWEPGLPSLEPMHGLDVTLTIDVRMQQLVEQELAAGCASQEARRGFAVLLDSATAQVLAMASLPGLDPDDSRDRPREGTVMGAVQEVYPPGSTFKPVMMAVALELGLVQPDSTIDCRRERGVLPGRRIRDTHPQERDLTLEEILVHSSNIGMANILMKSVSADTPKDTAAMAPVHDLLRRLGFGQLTGVPLPAESGGIVTPLSRWVRHWTLASVSYGQEISMTALQMAAAANTLVDGVWRQPTLVLGERSSPSSGWSPEPPGESRRVFSPRHVELVRSWMAASVAEGECALVRLPGLPVAGKTGTADSEVDLSREIHSYVALAPADDPAVTLVVVLAEPRHARYSSQSAAPVAGRILRRLMPYLGYRVE